MGTYLQAAVATQTPVFWMSVKFNCGNRGGTHQLDQQNRYKVR